MGLSWQAVVVEETREKSCSGMEKVEHCCVLWWDISVTSGPSRSIRRETYWSVRASTEHCAGGMWSVELFCTLDKVIKPGSAH
jgi:hypothetical protein